MNIKLSSPWLGQEEIDAVTDVLLSQKINMGMETKYFEEELYAFFGRSDIDVSCVNSCTAALHLALQCSDIGVGDEVLVPTYTFVSTFQAIKATGAIPIPCDVEIDDVFISLEDAQNRTTSKTKAIVPVLFAGCDGKIDRLYEFARNNSLIVVEDAAHCFGDEEIVQREGILCFSFDPIKNITCANGGAIVTSDMLLAKKIKNARLLGVVGDTDVRYNGGRSYDFETVAQGWRYQMNNIEAAIGRAQLRKFDQIKLRRRKYADMYINGLQNIDEIRLLPINIKTAVPHIFPIIVKNNLRDNLRKVLQAKGIETGVQYKPNHQLKYFNLGYELPNANELFQNMLSLPLHPALSVEDVTYIIDAINGIQNL